MITAKNIAIAPSIGAECITDTVDTTWYPWAAIHNCLNVAKGYGIDYST